MKLPSPAESRGFFGGLTGNEKFLAKVSNLVLICLLKQKEDGNMPKTKADLLEKYELWKYCPNSTFEL